MFVESEGFSLSVMMDRRVSTPEEVCFTEDNLFLTPERGTDASGRGRNAAKVCEEEKMTRRRKKKQPEKYTRDGGRREKR